jgi:hypothetical protein
MPFTLREMTEVDVPAVAALHVATFNETHTANNDGPSYELREYQWRTAFKESDGSWFGVVIENERGELVGFAKGRPHDGGVPGFQGDLNKIYLLRRYHRLGRTPIGCRAVGPGGIGGGGLRMAPPAALASPRDRPDPLIGLFLWRRLAGPFLLP